MLKLLLLLAVLLPACEMKSTQKPNPSESLPTPVATKPISTPWESDCNRSAIINGELAPEDPAIVKIKYSIPSNVPGVNFSAICTGALLDSRTVLFAKHCAEGGRFGHLVGSIGMKTLMNDQPSHDVVIGKLDKPVPCSKNYFVVGITPKVGDEIEIAGFGCYEPGKSDGKFRKGITKIARVDGLSFESGGAKTGASSICPGDSGGPAWIKGTRNLVGIAASVAVDWSYQKHMRADIALTRDLIERAMK